MSKLGIVITDGVGFRNFVLSNFLTEAQLAFDKIVILSCLPASIYQEHTEVKIIELPVFQEKFPTWFFRKAKELSHLQAHKTKNFGILDNLKANYTKEKSARGFATRFLFKLTDVFHSERWIQFFEYAQAVSCRNNPIVQSYHSLLKSEGFDLLFFTHQRPPFIAPLAFMAKKRKLKTASFIFSWDNLASKGRMAASFDYYLVWSHLMQQELLQFYPKVSENAIHIVGTPQFEPYVLERYASSKEDFYKKMHLDPTKKTICFSCGDISTSRNDELYITSLAELIGKEIPDVNLLVRTSPAEDPIRFQKIVEQFPNIKWNYPKWFLSREGHQETWSQRVPSVEDVIDLRAILEHSDLNINMLSTMSLDFMMFDKPVINIIFGTENNGLYNDQRFVAYEHIRIMLQTNATKLAKTLPELIQYINQYLNDGAIDASNRKDLIQIEVGKPLEGTSKRIAETLASLL